MPVTLTIIEARDRKALSRLLSRANERDAAFTRRVGRIVDAVRTGGDRALRQFARRFDASTGALEVSARDMRRSAARVPADVRRDDLAAVLALLPALQRPTISALSDDHWAAVNTIIEEKTVRDLIPKLKAARAEGIVEYPLNKIVL